MIYTTSSDIVMLIHMSNHSNHVVDGTDKENDNYDERHSHVSLATPDPVAHGSIPFERLTVICSGDLSFLAT